MPEMVVDKVIDMRTLPGLTQQPVATLGPVDDPGRKVFERTLCLTLTVGQWGVSRKAGLGAVTVDADKALLSMSKRLIQSESYGRIGTCVEKMRQYLKDTALPSFFKAGVYLIPVEMVPAVNAKLEAFRVEFEGHVETFLAEYPALVEAMAEPLGVLYDPRNYPPVEKVRAAFYCDWRYVSFDVPGRLRAISTAIFEQEREKAAAMFTEAGNDIKAALREAMAGLVGNLVERLKPGEDGKKRRLSDASVERMRGFLDTFDLRNITDDAELKAQVERARAVLGGADVESLREDKDLRASVLAGFEEVAASIQPLVVNRRTRAVTLEE